MSKFPGIFMTFIVALATSFLSVSYFSKQNHETDRKNAYERILDKGVLRCGYYVFPPALSIDPNTKEKTGFAVDITNEIAKKLHLKVEWTEEVTFGTMMPALQANHFDAICTPVWVNAAQGREVEYTRDLFYTPIVAVARQEDMRFKDTNSFNSPSITLATMDGEITSAIAADDFPQAKTLAVPNNSDLSVLFTNVKNKKADVTFTDLNALERFNKNNDNALKNITPDYPVRIFPFTLAVQKGEFELLSHLNYTITEMLYSGQIERIVRKHEIYPNSYLYISTPYRVDSLRK
ncbi:MAG: amino acid transporter substrate-binding protein family [Alphaproteobacteria bacterium]|nr:amino acid transporter substrate-binding protein family [Alphaproteobacteria bacterium]